MSCSNVLGRTIVLLGVLVAAQSLAAAPSQDVVCRDQLRPGSHIAMRVCATPQEWAASRARELAGMPPSTPLPPMLTTAFLHEASSGVGTVSISMNR